MNFRGKTGDSGSSSTSIRGGGEGGGYGYEEDDGEENEETPAPGQLFAPSSSPSSHHHHHHHHQPPPFLPPPPPPYHQQQQRGGWLMDNSSHGGEPSSSVRLSNDEDAHGHDEEAGGGEGMMVVVEREHMFDKVVTPSDVGKLNRLVIPKQHAERYFPLDSSNNDKGLLLNFEDRNGKPWRFRYSYWNSSQSYVMTKGWSRFVKDKKLDAGDIVSFQRGIGGSAKDRLFIDWRHRPDAPTHHHHLSSFPLPNHHHHFSFHSSRNSAASNIMNIHPWNPLLLQSHPVPPRSRSNMMQQPLNSYAASSYPYGGATGGHYQSFSTGNVVNVNQGGSGSVIYFRSGPQQQLDLMQRSGVGVGIDPPPLPAAPPPPPAVVFESVPVVHGKTAAKRLRLFGVNMDCPISEDDVREYYDPTSAPITTATDSIPMGPHHYVNYHHEHFRPPPHPPSSSSSSSSAFPYLQLRPYGEETQFNQTTIISSSSADALNKTTKSSSSNMSLDLDI